MLTTRICECDWCVRIYPKMKRVRAVLPSEIIEDFDYLMSELDHVGLYQNVAEAKLDGSWADWEWIVEEKMKRGLK